MQSIEDLNWTPSGQENANINVFAKVRNSWIVSLTHKQKFITAFCSWPCEYIRNDLTKLELDWNRPCLGTQLSVSSFSYELYDFEIWSRSPTLIFSSNEKDFEHSLVCAHSNRTKFEFVKKKYLMSQCNLPVFLSKRIVSFKKTF